MNVFGKILKRDKSSKKKKIDDENKDEAEEEKEESLTINTPKPKIKNSVPVSERITKTKGSSVLYKSVLRRPWVSEKARDLSTDSKYVFLVTADANKSEIKNEVERRWEVNVRSVNILRKKSKSRKFKRVTGTQRLIKRAIVTLGKDQKIDIYPA